MNLKNKIPSTVKTKTYLYTVLFMCIIFLGSLLLSRSAYVADETEAWLTQPLQEASYIIGEYNSTHYYARNSTGYGTSANKGYEWLDDNKTIICQSANDALTNGGTIVLMQGTYTLSSTNRITLNNDEIHVFGQGFKNTYITTASTSSYIIKSSAIITI